MKLIALPKTCYSKHTKMIRVRLVGELLKVSHNIIVVLQIKKLIIIIINYYYHHLSSSAMVVGYHTSAVLYCRDQVDFNLKLNLLELSGHDYILMNTRFLVINNTFYHHMFSSSSFLHLLLLSCQVRLKV